MIDKHTRRSKWHTAPPPDQKHRQQAVAWCVAQPSDGKFYYNYAKWWFEREKDAVLFALRWAQ